MKNLHFILFVFSLCFLTSCNSKPEVSKLFSSNLLKIENNIPYFQSDSFVANPLGFELSPIVFENHFYNYFDKSFEPVKNIHDTSLIDTIVNYSHANCIVQFYKTHGRTLLSAFDSDDPVLAVAGNVSVGIPKSDFIKIFGLGSLQNDTCEVGNEEGTFRFRFIFVQNKLSKITFSGYTD